MGNETSKKLAEGIRLTEGFLDDEECSALWSDLYENNINWTQDVIRVHDKHIPLPRLTAWYGDQDAIYRYSGIVNTPMRWLPILLRLKSKLERYTQYTYNSMLANYYRNERDSIGWHADDEPELGGTPAIASISIGTERLFEMKRKDKTRSLKIPLKSGSLLFMFGQSQREWLHRIDKLKTPCGWRMNLTFRYVYVDDGD